MTSFLYYDVPVLVVKPFTHLFLIFFSTIFHITFKAIYKTSMGGGGRKIHNTAHSSLQLKAKHKIFSNEIQYLLVTYNIKGFETLYAFL